MNVRLRPSLLAGLAILVIAPAQTRAAGSYDNCNNFIDSLPAVISTQGVWCLRKDLSTAQASGEAIAIATNNATIDCNGFKLGGLAAGAGTQTVGISTGGRLNATVRNCTIRGFLYGLYLNGSGGHVVEDNRFEGNTYVGFLVNGDGSMVRRNQVLDTGGTTLDVLETIGIHVWDGVDVLDNTVSGVTVPNAGRVPVGIRVDGGTGSISGNRVRGLAPSGEEYGIDTQSQGNPMLVGNQLRGSGSLLPGSIGIYCGGSTQTRVKDNIIAGFLAGHDCGDAGGNDSPP